MSKGLVASPSLTASCRLCKRPTKPSGCTLRISGVQFVLASTQMAQFVPLMRCHWKQFAVKCFLRKTNFSLNHSCRVFQRYLIQPTRFVSLWCHVDCLDLKRTHASTEKSLSSSKIAAVVCLFCHKSSQNVTKIVKLIGFAKPVEMLVQYFKIRSQKSFSIRSVVLDELLFCRDLPLSDRSACASSS